VVGLPNKGNFLVLFDSGDQGEPLDVKMGT